MLPAGFAALAEVSAGFAALAEVSAGFASKMANARFMVEDHPRGRSASLWTVRQREGCGNGGPNSQTELLGAGRDASAPAHGPFLP